MRGLFTRAIRPPDEPNGNDPITAAPGTVGPPSAVPGDPSGVLVSGESGPPFPPSRVVPSPWSGWPAEWATPAWNGQTPTSLGDTAWLCLDLNASVLATMPPYLVDAAPTLSADWLNNPDPDVYASWEDFAKSLFWDYMLGEAFVLCTARYSTQYPARFHVVPPWAVSVELAAGRRFYRIGDVDVTDDMLHLRYRSSVDQARGTGPLDVGALRLVAAEVLTRYGTKLAATGIPAGTLEHPEELTEQQSQELQQQWVQARLSTIGEPAVLSGGLKWNATQLNPTEMALVDLLTFNEARIAVLLGVPPFLVGLPSAGDSMTYSNVTSVFDFHWRGGLRPKAQAVMAGLSQWLLPRGTRVELNRDAYIQPEPLERAQTAQILSGIVDPATGQQALTVDEIRAAERLDDSIPKGSQGVLR